MPKKTEPKPFYRRIISDAWRIAWNHKHLWVFGFFATVAGFGGVTETLFSSSSNVNAFFPAVASGQPMTHTIPGLTTITAILKYTSFPVLSLLIFLAISGLCTAIFLWLAYTSAGALTSSVRKIEHGGEPTPGDGLKTGANAFWRVLGVNALSQLFIFCGYVLTSTTLLVLLSDHTVTSAIFYVGTFIMFTILVVAASIAAIYGTCFVTIKGEKKILTAVYAGWQLLLDHWLVTFEMAIALFIASLVIGLSAVFVALVVSVPFIFMMLITTVLHLGPATFFILMTASGVMLATIVCVGSFITVFQVSAWTLLWSEMTERQPLAKIHRLAEKFSPHLV